MSKPNARQSRSRSLNIVSWNIQYGMGMDGRVSLARIVTNARGLADFDVLCLQEVVRGFPALTGGIGHDQVAELKELLEGYTALYAPAVETWAPNGSRSQFGNAIFTRLPVVQAFRHLLPWPADSNAKSMQRGALEAVIQTRSGLLRIITAHLESFSPSQRLAQAVRLRELHQQGCDRATKEQVRDTSETPFKAVGRTSSTVIVGDFNARPVDPAHKALSEPFADSTPPLIEVWANRYPGRSRPATFGVHGCDMVRFPDAPLIFDYFYMTPDLLDRFDSMLVDSQSMASDHQPIHVCIRD